MFDPFEKSLLRKKDQVFVKVSANSARLNFLPCGPECIEKGCTAKCCDAPTHPDGIRVYVDNKEAKAIRALGVTVKDNFIKPRAGERLCPFKTADHLCGLFDSPDRPFGCVVSPFMLNKRGTLIIRNRYKLLPCYDPHRGRPAYEVFRSSLVAIFGKQLTRDLCRHLDSGRGDLILTVKKSIYAKLAGREKSLKAGKA